MLRKFIHNVMIGVDNVFISDNLYKYKSNSLFLRIIDKGLNIIHETKHLPLTNRIHFNEKFFYQIIDENYLDLKVELVLGRNKRIIGSTNIRIEDLNINTWTYQDFSMNPEALSSMIIFTVEKPTNRKFLIHGIREFTNEEVLSNRKVITSTLNSTVWSFDGFDGHKYVFKVLNRPNINEILPIYPLKIHKSMIDLEGFCNIDGKFGIIFKFIPNGSLYNLMKKSIDTRLLKRIVFDLMDCMDRMNAEGFIHRDIKPGNILIDSENKSLLCDFGLSRSFKRGDMMTINVGTSRYQAPETLNDNDYDYFIDIYSTGVLLEDLGFHSIVINEALDGTPCMRPTFIELNLALAIEYMSFDLFSFQQRSFTNSQRVVGYNMIYQNDYQYYVDNACVNSQNLFHCAFMHFIIFEHAKSANYLKLGELSGNCDCTLFFNLLKAMDIIAYDVNQPLEIDLINCSEYAYLCASYFGIGFPTNLCKELGKCFNEETRRIRDEKRNFKRERRSKTINDVFKSDSKKLDIAQLMNKMGKLGPNSLQQLIQKLSYFALSGNTMAVDAICSLYFFTGNYSLAKPWIEISMRNSLDSNKCMYYAKILFEENNPDSLKYMMKALELGEKTACFWIYNYYIKYGNNEMAQEYLRKGSELGEINCQALYSIILGKSAHNQKIEIANQGNVLGHFALMLEAIDDVDLEKALYHGMIYFNQVFDTTSIIYFGRIFELMQYLPGIDYCYKKIDDFRLPRNYLITNMTAMAEYEMDGDCLMFLYKLYIYSGVTQQHLNLAMKYLRIAAQIPFSEANFYLTIFYSCGILVQQNTEMANYHMSLINPSEYSSKDVNNTLRFFQKFGKIKENAIISDGRVCCWFGMYVKNRKLSPDNIKMAKEIYQKSAGLGYNHAKYVLFHINEFEKYGY